MLFTGVKKSEFEEVKAWQKQVTESEFRGWERITVGGLGFRRYEWNLKEHYVMIREAKSIRFTPSTQKHLPSLFDEYPYRHLSI